MSANESGQGVSHATGGSQVPTKAQEAVPSSVEHQLPDSLHDTGSNKETGKVSHATGDSKVPKVLQEGLPASVEKIVPNSVSVAIDGLRITTVVADVVSQIHDTSGAKFPDGSVGK
ncbi:hypothetical protein LTR82_016438 [Friedmanniomyces endolithicus]|uniref:Uncharacterized protein n=1 Tax=Friedmanniomyces endolithicus TaxID=329885 RepID=A0AAN6F5Z8_9PEZI|nr:hypothetical protein LTR82_016438 [Friedmanniomyces endolithicus]